MKNIIKPILIITCMVIGLALLIYCAIHINNYPGMKEMHKAASAEILVPQYIGLALAIIAYGLTYVKKKF